MGSTATVTASNFELTPMRVTFNGVDLGGTKGGVAVSVKGKISDLMADQFGPVAIDGVFSGAEYECKFTLVETQKKDNWKVAFPHMKLVTSGGNKMMYFENIQGDKLSARAADLILHPLSKADADKAGDFKFFKAVAVSASEVKFGPEEQVGLEVTMRILPDTTTSPARYMIHGDPAIGLVAASAAAAVAGGGNVGNGTVGSLSAGSKTKTETVTLECVGEVAAGGNFKVTGSLSGIIGVAEVGTPFTSDYVNFTIADGSTDFDLEDSFTIATTAANYA